MALRPGFCHPDRQGQKASTKATAKAGLVTLRGDRTSRFLGTGSLEIPLSNSFRGSLGKQAAVALATGAPPPS